MTPDHRQRRDAAPRHALLTGGAGFVGSHLADRLLERGDRVTVLDDLSTGRRENLPERHARLEFIRGDVRRADALLAGRSFDEVYHLAAAVGVRLVMDDPIRAIETNVEGASAVLRLASGAGPGGGPAPLLLASSSEVYGKPNTGVFSEDDDVHYGPTTVTRWSYACGKAMDEYLALAYARHRALPVVVARLFNTVGPRQVGDYGMVLPRFVAAALRHQPILVHGDGSQSRCFCDVRDVAEALPRMLSSPACRGRVLNLGSDRPITIEHLARTVIAELSSRSEVRFVPYADAYPTGFEDIRHRRPDLARVREAIGFAPRIPLEQTIRDLAAHLRAAGALAEHST